MVCAIRKTGDLGLAPDAVYMMMHLEVEPAKETMKRRSQELEEIKENVALQKLREGHSFDQQDECC